MGFANNEVAIIGMGCTEFGEHWERSLDDLLVEATGAALDSAPGLDPEQIGAYWFGTHTSGGSGMALSRPLKLRGKPVTRVENMCATGSDAFRNACYAVASGAYDSAMVVGGEKLKDSGYSGLAVPAPAGDATTPDLSGPALFSLLVPAYANKYGVGDAQMREVLTHIAWKNHRNGSLNERAQFRSEVSRDRINNSPIVAGSLRVHDCSGVADGAAAAIIVRAEDASRYTDKPVHVVGLSLVAGAGDGPGDVGYDYTTLPEVTQAAEIAYRQAGITDPAREISMAEVHDCFTPTELVLMEDLGFSERGQAWKDVLAGRYDLDGDLPVNPDGGLKSFGHPIGASGLRMMYEMWLQFRGEAGSRQLADPKFGLTHNLGGSPGDLVTFVSILSGPR